MLNPGDPANSIAGITNQGSGAVTLSLIGISGWTYWAQAVSMHTFAPPSPGETMKITLGAPASLWVSFDGGHLFLPYMVPCQVTMQVTARLDGP